MQMILAAGLIGLLAGSHSVQRPWHKSHLEEHLSGERGIAGQGVFGMDIIGDNGNDDGDDEDSAADTSDDDAGDEIVDVAVAEAEEEEEEEEEEEQHPPAT